MTGPPFSVSIDELKKYFSDSFSVNLIERQIISQIKPHWREKGLQALEECAYVLEKL